MTTLERLRYMAYLNWCGRGKPAHDDWTDWFQAERVLSNCQEGVTWTNYTRTYSVMPESICAPTSIDGLVTIVRRAEAQGKRVHAFGSKWALSDCALTTDFLIDTTAFDKPIQSVQLALRPGGPTVFHVEGGIRIRNLYDKLNQMSLALETMGGASGQTLAGAISTGTHGGDKFLPPLADSVLALHLVGTGGTQYWIEPTQGITDPSLLQAHVVPAIASENIIYDDATFNACLVSFGCMGIIYAVVLRVRPSYDLVETTVETTWNQFKSQKANLLADRTSRFLQVVVSPYKDSAGNNLCLMTTRSETDPGNQEVRPKGDATAAALHMMLHFDVDTAVREIWQYGICPDNTLSEREKFRRIIDDALRADTLGIEHSNQTTITKHYDNIMRTQLPPATFRGASYSVMDTTYGQPILTSEPAYSMEFFFPGSHTDPKRDFTYFVDELIKLVTFSTYTVLSGYISLRFMGQTRATIGMQQWPQTCAVEISVMSGVRGVDALMDLIYQVGIESLALPHWGQQIDIRSDTHASRYAGYLQWRQVFARMSNNFKRLTFANQLSDRWGLTTRDAAQFAEQSVTTRMIVGESQTVSVIMRNVGVTTWTASSRYKLATLAPSDGNTVPWGYSRADLPGDVPPGAMGVFLFPIIAPNQPGVYPFQWRMRHEEGEWYFFGEATPLLHISVELPADRV